MMNRMLDTHLVPSLERDQHSYRPSVLAKLDELSFRLRDVEKIRRSSAFHLPQQYTTTYIMIVIMEGEGVLTDEQGKRKVQAKSVHWLAPGTTLGLRSSGRKGISLLLIRFDSYMEQQDELQRLDQSAQSEKDDSYFACNVSSSWLLPLCESLYEQWTAGKSGSRARAGSLFVQMLCDLQEQESAAEGDIHIQLQRTYAYIGRHYREPLTLDQLADMAGISRNYYVSLFKKYYGESVIHYITRLRMEEARRLMTNPELRLRDIAHQIGYNDEFYFSRKFKQETGVTPSAYIRNHQRKIASYDPVVTGYLLAMGIIPYAAPLHPKWTGHDKRQYAADIPVHLKVQRANTQWRENISILTSCQPELIIAPNHISLQEKQLLENIAPVHYMDAWSTEWQDQLLQLARQLGEEQQAQRWLDRYHEQNGQIRRQLAEQGLPGQVLFVRYWKGHFYSCRLTEAGRMLREDLQLNLLSLTGNDDEEHEDLPFTLEQITRADADRILLLICQESETLLHWKELIQQPSWQSMQAVRQEHVHILSSDPWRDCSPEAYKRMAQQALAVFTDNRP